MNDDTTRAVSLTRLGHGRYEAVNVRGGTIKFSTDREQTFTPVELFLASIAGCTAIDVDFITSKRSEPVRFEVSMTANKVRDEHGNHLVNLAMTFDVAFPDDDGGRAAAGVLPDAIARTHDRLCTVSRTIEIGTPVATSIADHGGRTEPSSANGNSSMSFDLIDTRGGRCLFLHRISTSTAGDPNIAFHIVSA